jgi:hypothetical protein
MPLFSRVYCIEWDIVECASIFLLLGMEHVVSKESMEPLVDGSKCPIKKVRENAQWRAPITLTLIWDGKF